MRFIFPVLIPIGLLKVGVSSEFIRFTSVFMNYCLGNFLSPCWIRIGLRISGILGVIRLMITPSFPLPVIFLGQLLLEAWAYAFRGPLSVISCDIKFSDNTLCSTVHGLLGVFGSDVFRKSGRFRMDRSRDSGLL